MIYFILVLLHVYTVHPRYNATIRFFVIMAVLRVWQYIKAYFFQGVVVILSLIVCRFQVTILILGILDIVSYNIKTIWPFNS